MEYIEGQPEKKSHKGQLYVVHACTMCGKKHYIIGTVLRKKGVGFCSQECFHKHRVVKNPYTMARCEICGKEFRTAPCLIKAGNRCCSKKCSNIYKRQYRGPKSPRWKGGRTTERLLLRNSINAQQWRQSIFLRDDFTCKKCGQRGGYLEAHHIKTFDTLVKEAEMLMPLLPITESLRIYTPAWDLNNGITLCRECHYETHYGKKKESK